MITFYDALMLFIVLVCIWQGAWKGMVWQIAPVASLVGGYMVAYPLSMSTAKYFGEPPLNQLWAMIAIYLAVSMAVYLLVRSVRDSLEKMKMVEFDRHLGALLGGVKGVLFTLVITIGLISVSPQAREIILKSESSTIAARIMNTISPVLPVALNDLIRPYIQKLNEAVPQYADEERVGLTPTTKRVARQDRLAKPKRFLDDVPDVLAPPARDLDEFDEPRPSTRKSTSRSLQSTLEDEARNAAKEILRDLMTTPSNSGRQAEPLPDDEFDVVPPAKPSRRAPKQPVEELPPPANDADDFFTADPDKALTTPR